MEKKLLIIFFVLICINAFSQDFHDKPCCGFDTTEYTGIYFVFSVYNKPKSLENVKPEIYFYNFKDTILVKNDTEKEKMYSVPDSFFENDSIFGVIIDYGDYHAVAHCNCRAPIFTGQCTIYMNLKIRYQRVAKNFHYYFSGYIGYGYFYESIYNCSRIHDIKIRHFKAIPRRRYASLFVCSHDDVSYPYDLDCLNDSLRQITDTIK
jgi:hypothetical protein